jgi:2-keto-4-pentenoate hydratase/2-oxohepta-3-ene-1,7-dioic acid hydratase in catechol pathway
MMLVEHWQMCTYRARDGRHHTGALRDDLTIVRLPDGLGEGHGLIDLMDDWATLEERLRGWDTSDAAKVADAELLAPLLYPRKVICTGANYRKHLVEMGPKLGDERSPEDRLGAQWRPFFFLKPPTTTVRGHDEDLGIDDSDDRSIDWEAELAVIIGKRGRDISLAGAIDHIAGYCPINDISDRSAFKRPGPPTMSWDWVGMKAIDDSAPMGPGITPHWMVSDPQNLDFRLTVDDQLEQEANTSQMIFDIAQQISAISEVMTLEPGDVIATGTAQGVGMGQGKKLRPGNVVTVTIDGVGELRNRIVAR